MRSLVCPKGAKPASVTPPVRMGLSVAQAERLHDDLQPGQPASVTVQRLLDQLWLRSVLVEQRRRTRIQERDGFDQRADGLLAALDPAAAAMGPTT